MRERSSACLRAPRVHLPSKLRSKMLAGVFFSGCGRRSGGGLVAGRWLQLLACDVQRVIEVVRTRTQVERVPPPFTRSLSTRCIRHRHRHAVHVHNGAFWCFARARTGPWSRKQKAHPLFYVCGASFAACVMALAVDSVAKCMYKNHKL